MICACCCASVRVARGRRAVALHSRTIQSTPESGARAGYGAKRRKGTKVHAAVDTLGHLALHVPPANEQDRTQVAQLVQAVQNLTDLNVTLAYVDQGYTGENAKQAAQAHGIELEVIEQA